MKNLLIQKTQVATLILQASFNKTQCSSVVEYCNSNLDILPRYEAGSMLFYGLSKYLNDEDTEKLRQYVGDDRVFSINDTTISLPLTLRIGHQAVRCRGQFEAEGNDIKFYIYEEQN